MSNFTNSELNEIKDIVKQAIEKTPTNPTFIYHPNDMYNKCEAGCKIFAGGEIKHHKDCYHYPNSMSESFDEKKVELKALKKENEDLKEKMKGMCRITHSTFKPKIIID